PSIKALRLVQSTSVYEVVASTSAQMVAMPRSRHQSITSVYEGPFHIESRNAEPIAPRKDLGEKGSLVFFVVMTPAAPAASEVRRIAPTFTGLFIWCSTTSSGFASSCEARRDSEASGLCAS